MCGSTIHVCKISGICCPWMPPMGYCFLKWSWRKTMEDRGCVLTLIFERSLVTMLSSRQFHLLPDHSSSLFVFPNLLTHGHNVSCMKLSFTEYSFTETQPSGFIRYCNKTFSCCTILWKDVTGHFATNKFQISNRKVSDLQQQWVWPLCPGVQL